MYDYLSEKVVLVGAGNMAQAYAKALDALGAAFVCVGRGEESAQRYREATGRGCVSGGIENYILEHEAPKYAIISVRIEDLADIAIKAMEWGVRHILLEKPGGASTQELEAVSRAALASGVEVLVAYNRRFYASTLAAEDRLQKQGGPLTCTFEFTEWLHVFEKIRSADERRKENLLLGNSSHVIDLAFYLCGWPKTLFAETAGEAGWYGNKTRFCGSGVTERGALFSYHANWREAGRWGVEATTAQERLIFRPLEQLHTQSFGSVIIGKAEIDDRLDIEYKPGIYLQTKAFFEGKERGRMVTIHDQARHARVFDKIAGELAF